MGELLRSPLSGITLTLGLFLFSKFIYDRFKPPLLRPAPVTLIALIVLIESGLYPFDNYESGGRLLQFFLGPAVVAMALPLHRHWPKIQRQWKAISASITLGAVIGIVSALEIAKALGAPPEVLKSLAPKSVTSPIGMAITEAIGGIPVLAAAIIFVVGLIGAEISEWVFRLLGINNPRAKGLALGGAAHGLGSTRAFEISEESGAYSSLGICLMGVATAVFVPLLIKLI